jgi:GMP synthase-like glutamine amidotransferase
MFNLCVLNCDDAKAWSPIDFADMFKSSIYHDCDSCHLWNIAKEKKLPGFIESCTAIVITGSRFNCRDSAKLDWFEPLCAYVRAVAESGKQRIYGGCFGCQLIAHALGGTVDYNPKLNFVLKAETIQIKIDTFWKYLPTVATSISCACSTEASLRCKKVDQSIIADKETINMICSHGDCVIHLPPDSELLASSESCQHEIYVTGVNRNILACQSHPEFELEYSVYERIWPAVVDTSNRLTVAEIEEAKASFEQYTGEDAIFFRKLISAFLRNHETQEE